MISTLLNSELFYGLAKGLSNPDNVSYKLENNVYSLLFLGKVFYRCAGLIAVYSVL